MVNENQGHRRLFNRPSLVDMVLDDTSIDARIEKVRQQVRDATKDALKTSSLEPLSENDDPDASFQLGVNLFGSGVSSAEESVQLKLDTIEKDLKQVMEEIQTSHGSSTSHQEAQDSSRPPDVLEAESKVLKIKLRFLKECSRARALLDESATLYTEALAPKQEIDLSQAAELHVQAKQCLSSAKSVLDGAGEAAKHAELLTPARKIYDSVHTTQIRQTADIIAKATSLWHDCVLMSGNSIVVTNPTNLNVFYNVLQVMNESFILEGTLRKFTGCVMKDIIDPLIKSHLKGQPLKSSVTLSESAVGGVRDPTSAKGHRLEWSVDSSTNETAGIPPWNQTLESIANVTRFLCTHVLLSRGDLCGFLKERLMGQPKTMPSSLDLKDIGIESPRLGDDDGLLIHPLVQALEETCIPKSLPPNKLSTLQRMSEDLAGYLSTFTIALTSQQLLSTSEDSRRLMDVAENFKLKYVDRRRALLLVETRDMLLKNDYHNTTQVGEEIIEDPVDAAVGIVDGVAVFKLHRSSVSDTAFKLMATCRSIMDEAVSVPTFPANDPLSSLAGALYRAAREVLSFFRAIIPVSYAKEIASLPRTAAVLHNDCVYLAHHCHTLGLEYKPRFPQAEEGDTKGRFLRQTCMFLDMVPLFREMADRSMGEMLDKQAQQVSSLVSERTQLLGKALESNEDLAEWSDAEAALDAGLYHLRHLSETWRPILATEILNRSMCFLADVMLNIFLDQLAKANDISTAASQFVTTLFSKATEDLSTMMNPSQSRVWDRFTAIGKFMDMSISDIQVALSDGLFRNVTAPELAKLVSACFANTPKRHHLLQSLSASGQRP